jgi:2-oxoisovalerate dehydrogenase E1 component
MGSPCYLHYREQWLWLKSPVNEQYRSDSLIEKARGYGMEGIKIDGNNPHGYDTIKAFVIFASRTRNHI